MSRFVKWPHLLLIVCLSACDFETSERYYNPLAPQPLNDSLILQDIDSETPVTGRVSVLIPVSDGNHVTSNQVGSLRPKNPINSVTEYTLSIHCAPYILDADRCTFDISPYPNGRYELSVPVRMHESLFRGLLTMTDAPDAVFSTNLVIDKTPPSAPSLRVVMGDDQIPELSWNVNSVAAFRAYYVERSFTGTDLEFNRIATITDRQIHTFRDTSRVHVYDTNVYYRVKVSNGKDEAVSNREELSESLVWLELSPGILKMSPSNDLFLINDGRINMYDTQSGRLSHTFSNSYPISNGAFSLDGKYFYADCYYGPGSGLKIGTYLCTYQLPSFSLVSKVFMKTDGLMYVNYAFDDWNRFYAANGENWGRIEVYDATTGGQVVILGGFNGSSEYLISDIVYHSLSRRLLAYSIGSSGLQARLYDVSSTSIELVASRTLATDEKPVFSLDGKFLYVIPSEDPLRIDRYSTSSLEFVSSVQLSKESVPYFSDRPGVRTLLETPRGVYVLINHIYQYLDNSYQPLPLAILQLVDPQNGSVLWESDFLYGTYEAGEMEIHISVDEKMLYLTEINRYISVNYYSRAWIYQLPS